MTPDSIRFSWITAQSDGTDHAVTDEAHVASMEAGHGVFEALCGAEFLAASMDSAPRGGCSGCRAFLRARRELRDFDDRMTEHRPSWFARLFCRHQKPPVDVGCPPAPTSAGSHTPPPGASCVSSESAPAGSRHKRGRHAA